MKILLVTDQYFAANNGLTISARRLCETLRSHGYEVRVIAFGDSGKVPVSENAYLMRKQYIPIFDRLVASQGMTFAKPDRQLIHEAVVWADMIHVLAPFVLGHEVIREARRQQVPYTAAFHVQPENISSSIHLGRCQLVNRLIYWWFRQFIYRYCPYIHCPSRFIARELRRNGYKQKIRVISNGIDPDFSYAKLRKSSKLRGKFVILMIGRMSIEKRQDVLIRAVAMSRHEKEIQLILAGKGPRRAALQRHANVAGVTNPVLIHFFSKEKLRKLIAMSDLYVHAADMEIEAMSCMEAFAGGLVPVIANSSKSATPQFALDERSLFPADDSQALAERIDYWLEHPNERKEMEYRYSELARKYALEDCVHAMEIFFHQAMEHPEKFGYQTEKEKADSLS